MLSHLRVHPPPLLWKSLIDLFSIPRLISGTNFLLHFVNQFYLLMLVPNPYFSSPLSASIIPSLIARFLFLLCSSVFRFLFGPVD